MSDSICGTKRWSLAAQIVIDPAMAAISKALTTCLKWAWRMSQFHAAQHVEMPVLLVVVLVVAPLEGDRGLREAAGAVLRLRPRVERVGATISTSTTGAADWLAAARRALVLTGDLAFLAGLITSSNMGWDGWVVTVTETGGAPR